MIRIVYFGTPNFSALVLEKLTRSFTIQAVVTQPDKQVGRKQVLTPSPVAQVAQKYNIPTLKPEKLDEDFIRNHLPLLESDLFILAAYGKLLPPKLLEIPKHGSLNIHPSLLPKYRGPSPIQAAILNGDKVTGVTIIKMDKEMDHGPIISAKEISLSGQETLESLSKQLFSEGADILIKIILDFVNGKITPVEQNHAIATYCHIIKKEAGYFDINNPLPSEQLDRMIRAYYPWPGVWTRWSPSRHPDPDVNWGKDLKIIKFYPRGVVHPDQTGIQMEGKKPMRMKEFLKGRPDFPIL